MSGSDIADLGSVRTTALNRARRLLAKCGRTMEKAEFEITDAGGVMVQAVRFGEAIDSATDGN